MTDPYLTLLFDSSRLEALLSNNAETRPHPIG